MKRITFLFVILATHTVTAQEFPVYANGLIYDEGTMQRLGVIVDSLNVRFRKCDVAHPYYSYEQGRGIFVDVPSKEAEKLIGAGISIEEYKKKIAAGDSKEKWIVKSKYKNYKGKKLIIFRELLAGNCPGDFEVKDSGDNNKTTGWIMESGAKKALWLNNLKAIELPEKYARSIQYVDCMVDTTTDVLYEDAENETLKKNEDVDGANFVAWARQFSHEPVSPDYDKMGAAQFELEYGKYLRKHLEWDSLRLIHLDKAMEQSSYYANMLERAKDHAIESKSSFNELEFYIARYISKSDALAMKRARRVIGYCSQDQSPRIHAVGICMLSAETAQWNVFLRSHLNVMNDRFERRSDGSYAWGQRKTSVSRVGRALADAKDKDVIEGKLLSMIADNQLDAFNRMVMSNTLKTYISELEDQERKITCNKKLVEILDKIPTEIRLLISAN